MFTLKAIDDSDASQSILVPFGHKWEPALRENKIQTVFRKRGPKAFIPNSIFVYVGAPSCLLLGLLQVKLFEFLPLSEALTHATSGGLTEADLRNYAAEYKELAVFRVGAIQLASTPLTLDKLASSYGFYPPQSFMRLSASGELVLLEALGLAKSSK